MTDRYANTVDEIWSRRSRFVWLCQAAIHCAAATDSELEYPVARAVSRIRTDVDHSLEQWADLEERYDHDVAAFVELVRGHLDAEAADRWHLGRTSSDLVETAFAYQMVETHQILSDRARLLASELARLALQHKDDAVSGRTHGQCAELTTIGRKFMLHALAVSSAFPPDPYNVTKLSGPVGVDARANNVLRGDRIAGVPATQIVPRWMLAEYVSSLTAFTVTISTLATEIRLASQEEGWLAEGRRTGEARGSSSMPHKRNPIRSERAAGLCKAIRFDFHAVIEAGAELWAERDISHSSVERTSLVQGLSLLSFVLSDMAKVVRDLEVHPDIALRTSRQVTSAGALREAVDAGASHREAYAKIRELGPSRAAATYGVSGLGAIYDPESESALWEWCRRAAGKTS